MSNLSTEEKIQILDQLKRSIVLCHEWDQDYSEDVKATVAKILEAD